MKKRTTIYIDEDLLLLLRHSCNIDNISDLIRDLIEAYIFDTTGEDLRAIRQETILKLTREIRQKRESQRKILIEQETSEEQARNYMEERIRVFTEEAGIFFSKNSGWKLKLPNLDPNGDFEHSWLKAAYTLSDLCGFPVTVEECQQYVSKEGTV